jgi:HK97 family phage portal protein
MRNRNIMARLTPGFVQRAIIKSWLPFDGGYNADNIMGGGAPVWLGNDRDAMVKQGFMMNPDVYMIVSFMTRLAAQIPWVLYEVKDEKWLNRYKNLDPLDGIRANLTEKKALEDVGNHKITEIWQRPNELQGQSEFVEQMYGYKLVTGETFVHGLGPETGPNQGQFHELDVMPAQMVGIKYGSPVHPVANYYWTGDPSRRPIPKEIIMHSKFWNPLPYQLGGLHGMSPLQSAMRVVTRNNDSLTASVKSLQNMGAIGMLSRYVGTPGEKGLTQEQAELIEKKYYQKYGGARNAGKIMVTGAAVKWQQMGMSPVDLKIIEQEQMDLRRLCGVYGLQSQLFNDPENKVYANMKEGRQMAYTQAVIPGMRSIRDELNRWWIEPFRKTEGKNYWFDMDLQAVPELQTNIKELMEWLRDAEMLTMDEKREVIDYERLDLPGMDQIWMDGNKVTMDQAMMDVDNVDKYLDTRL